MTTKFVLVRHGQTEWNVGERFRGHADLALTETGVEQARRIATRLGSEKFAAIYCSPLRRAQQTAQALSDALRLPVQTHEGLNDIDFGALEGMTMDEAGQAFPQVVATWLKQPSRAKFPKGNSFKQVRTRIEKMLNELSDKHDEQTVALVSHKVICAAMLCLVLGMRADALWQIQQDVACINRFEHGKIGWIVTLINDVHHLK